MDAESLARQADDCPVRAIGMPALSAEANC